jgi:hypothetical protein
VVSVQRLWAHARLDDSPESLARAEAEAADGDESWAQWVAEYQRGDALLVRLDLRIELAGEADDVVGSTIEGLFVERAAHPPKVERQIAELASGDFVALADELLARGHEVDRYELGEMYVHVELDQDVRRRVAAGTTASSAPAAPHRRSEDPPARL